MSSVPGFDYEIFVAVKNHVKGYVDDWVRLIVADRDAGNGYEASFSAIAQQTGYDVTRAIFADIVTNDELAQCTEAWNKKRK